MIYKHSCVSLKLHHFPKVIAELPKVVHHGASISADLQIFRGPFPTLAPWLAWLASLRWFFHWW